MATSTIRIVPQGEILKGTPEPPELILPEGSLFSRRAARFALLSEGGHSDGAFLSMLGRLAQAQQGALDLHILPAPPDPSHLELCRRHGLPPLAKDGVLDPAWRDALGVLLATLAPTAPPAVARVIRTLEAASSDTLEAMADRVLGLDFPELDPATVPLVAAALQVHWVSRAAALGAAAFGKLDVANLCPICGSLPVAGVLKLEPAPGVRYLHCALCSADWQFARGTCSQCETREKVAYYHVEGGQDAVKVETCGECQGYIKLMNMEKDPQVDPVADDLATLALDILMDESGFQRASPNYFFVPGQT